MKKLLSNYFNLMVIFIGLSSLGTILLLFKANRTDEEKFYFNEKVLRIPQQIEPVKRTEENTIECKLLEKLNVPCIKKNNEFYLPFEFIRKKFDIQGRINEAEKTFKLSFSYAKSYKPEKNYNSSAEYLWFSDINVESRDRVKYVNLRNGVPVSSQWNKLGHIYPVQVGQFGLSHFSKWIKIKLNPKHKYHTHKFIVKGKTKFIHHENQNAIVKPLNDGFEFKFPEKAIYKMNYSFDIRYIIADLYTNSYFELIIDMMLRDTSLSKGNYIVRLIYKFNNTQSNYDEQVYKILNDDQTYQVIYSLNGLGEKNAKLKFIRNFCLDACKGLQLKCELCLKSLNESMILNNETLNNNHLFISQYYKIYQISLNGEGVIGNGSLSEEAPNFEIAKMASDFFLKTQNLKTGGWAINVTRKFDKKSKLFLRPGWYSAMAQGHGISLLCRMYAHLKDRVYLEAAARALDLYEVKVEDNGIKAIFMNTSYVWYEEYPTTPHNLFVLNGFLYSLFGLNDFIDGCIKNAPIKDEKIVEYEAKAKKIYSNGLISLKHMISLYDSGTRTFYDLKHISNPNINPNVARWDYHSLHISQLFYLANIIEQKESFIIESGLLKDVAKRWLGYSNGIWNENSQIKA